MNGSRPRAGRRFMVGLACVALSAAACSGGDENHSASDPTPTASTSGDAATKVEAEIESVFQDYWNAVIQAQSGQSDDPASLFDGIATDATTEDNVGIAQRYAQEGITRVGEPVISDVTVNVVSDSGVVSACVDESDWVAQLPDGSTLPPPEEQLAPHPVVFEVVGSDGSWLIGDPIEPGGTITC
ncbi:hypothetical protein [Jiangella asiatica]|uniref:Nuclear transport factor 2 family protein n=1 Tax=Jiangella asiatica TaxID=2530372 RepID=A0A4R5DPC6_9ACTN|nr:hypothetical protein [Jiangella asiatica]TDE12603.1 hypothetical protein E1269_07105 [Jiangella asiatica]